MAVDLKVRWITTAEAARKLGVSPSAVRRAVIREELRGRKVSPRLWLVDEYSLPFYLPRKGPARAARRSRSAALALRQALAEVP